MVGLPVIHAGRDLGSSDGTYLDEECIEVAPVVGLSALRLGAGGPKIWLKADASAPAPS